MHASLRARSLVARGARAALVAIVLVASLTACAPQRPAPGALAPVAARSTNQSRAADLAALDAWERHRASLMRNDGPDLAARGVALARAGAWLAFAREAYVARPLSRDADDALAEARALMAPFEGRSSAAGARSVLATGADRLSPDNWAEVERLASTPAAVADATSLAEAEIELVRAAAGPAQLPMSGVVLAGMARDSIHSIVELPSLITASSSSVLACRTAAHIARAVALLGEADLVQRGEERQRATIDRLQQDDRVRTRQLHFAVRSDLVGMPSAALLHGVAGAMLTHPELSLVIEGHADPRGVDDDNRALSGRRATTVRDILADSGVTDDRMLVREFGATRLATPGTSMADYARDRRVQLKFVLPDGEELPITDDSAVDLQIERVVQRSAAVRRHTGTRRARAATGRPR